MKIEDFWKWVDVRGPDECWEWKRGRTSRGYGEVYLGSRKQYTHRVAWETTNGTIPDGLEVRHVICDNPPCCNPAHLAPGTHTDNMQDAARRGRNGVHTHPDRVARGDRHGSRTHPEKLPRGARNGAYTHPDRRPHGERHGQSKLREHEVLEIRQKHKYGGASIGTLAEEYTVSKSTVKHIVHYRTWKYLK